MYKKNKPIMIRNIFANKKQDGTDMIIMILVSKRKSMKLFSSCFGSGYALL